MFLKPTTEQAWHTLGALTHPPDCAQSNALETSCLHNTPGNPNSAEVRSNSHFLLTNGSLTRRASPLFCVQVPYTGGEWAAKGQRQRGNVCSTWSRATALLKRKHQPWLLPLHGCEIQKAPFHGAAHIPHGTSLWLSQSAGTVSSERTGVDQTGVVKT